MPPLATGTVLSVMDGVVVPVATTIGEVPVTLVTVPLPAPIAFQALLLYNCSCCKAVFQRCVPAAGVTAASLPSERPPPTFRTSLVLSQSKLGSVSSAEAPLPKRILPSVNVVPPVPPFATGMVGVAVTAPVPLPSKYPVRVLAPVPPLATETVPVTFAAFPAILPRMLVPGMVANPETAPVPLPKRYPESVVLPVPPFVTGTVPSEIAGVVVPVVTLIGLVPVTLVTVPSGETDQDADEPFVVRTSPANVAWVGN